MTMHAYTLNMDVSDIRSRPYTTSAHAASPSIGVDQGSCGTCPDSVTAVPIQLMLLLQLLCPGVFRSNVRFNFFSIGVTIGQGGIDLRQRYVWNLRGDLFWDKALFVPPHDAPDGDTRFG